MTRARTCAAKTEAHMMDLDGLLAEIGSIGHLDSLDAAAKALAVLQKVAAFIPPPAGPMASAALELAKDAVLAGKGPESIEELRGSVRGSWQADLDRRFPNG
jgi:hypothetical protein